jgi:mono/diheme cytochrome c family protein
MIPVSLRIAALAVATTAFYTYVGQLVPQKEVQPPVEVALSKDMGPEEMIRVGREIMDGKGLCFTCHTVGKSGALRFPDLDGIGSRAATRIPGLSDVEYLVQSMYEPDTYIVPGFNPGMPVINKPPIGLTDDEIRAVIAYLQSLGGTVTVNMQTALNGQPGDAPAPATDADGDAGATPGAPSPVPGTVPEAPAPPAENPGPDPGDSGTPGSGPGSDPPGQPGQQGR